MFKWFTGGDLIVLAVALVSMGVSYGGTTHAVNQAVSGDEEIRAELKEIKAIPITHGAATEIAAIKVQMSSNAEATKDLREAVIRFEERLAKIQDQNAAILVEIRRR